MKKILKQLEKVKKVKKVKKIRGFQSYRQSGLAVVLGNARVSCPPPDKEAQAQIEKKVMDACRLIAEFYPLLISKN